MRYHYEMPESPCVQIYGDLYRCNHPVYNFCTLFKIGDKGLAVIEQYFDPDDKATYWSQIEPWICNIIYTNPGFKVYFDENAGVCENGLYPTVTVRQIMWALRMKPLPKERWETVFDRKKI